MNKDRREFLASLLNAPSPSGHEGPARKIWCDSLRDRADEVTVDVHGNAIATLNPKGSPHVMLAGHIDEIGFQICHIEERGLLRFRTIGGHDLRTVAGRRVQIHTATGPIFGVVGKAPVHLLRDRQRNQAPKVSELWIDAGFDSRKKAERVIEIGDPVTYLEGFSPLRGSLAVARGFDNRAGAFVVAEVLRTLSRAKGLQICVSAVATVQEEIGLRGAHTSTFGLNPDVGIAVDVTWATDNPGGDAKELGEVKLGDGPVITRGPNVNPVLYTALKATAGRDKVSVQYRALPGGTGTDANAIQLSRAGVATGLVSIPNRYMHSPVEICDLGDIDGAIKLIAGTIRRFNKRSSFIPKD